MKVRRDMQMMKLTTAIAVLVLLGGSVALAAAKPKPGTYFSVSPSVEVTVSNAQNSVTLYTSCGPGSDISAYWDSSKLTLHNGSFSFNKRTTVQKVQDHPFSTTPVQATVLFTGHFSGGKFTGKVHLGGSTCSEQSYTAHFSSGGAGRGGRG
jgi:hypothetical protein